MPKKPTLKDLVYLKFADNPSYLKVIKRKPSEIEINLESEIWKLNGIPYKIGTARYVHTIPGSDNSIIGVYNRNNINHLNSMINASLELIRRPN